MALKPQSGFDQREKIVALEGFGRRENHIKILFVCCSVEDVERCSHELTRVRFTVAAELAVSAEELNERTDAQHFDLVIARCPIQHWQGPQLIEQLMRNTNSTPLIFLAYHLELEVAAELILNGAADCIETDNIGHLPVAVHRALDAKSLREQRDRAEKDLRHSEARYRALTGNLSYGICRCTVDGRFLEVNEAMMKMLGYDSREELLAQNLARDTIQNSETLAQLLGQPGAVEPVEANWKRSDDKALKVRLSGREVLGELGELEAYEIIAEDVTRQRELESHLRRLAASDSLTGLANYRRLVDVLDLEIKRSERTNRAFAVLFFDLDGLKQINDRHGHMVGSRALCRLADALCSGCRAIDTPARFGGDEFALVLPETDAEAANLIAHRICDSLANDGRGPKLSVSFGVAVYGHGNTIESLLSEADSALYSMKRHRQPVIEPGNVPQGYKLDSSIGSLLPTPYDRRNDLGNG